MTVDRPDAVILSITPAPAARPMVVLSIWRDDEGWWRGWAEPVLYVALVERRWYTVPHFHLRDERSRRQALRETERVLDPVVYDVNAPGRLSTFDEMWHTSQNSVNEHLEILPAEAGWETVVEQIQEAGRELHRRQESATSPRVTTTGKAGA